MPKLKSVSKKTVSSLVSLSVDCVAANVFIYTESLEYLPPYIKEIILRKLLRRGEFRHDLSINKILSFLIHPDLKQINLASVNVDDGTLNVLENCRMLTDITLRNCDNQSFSSEGLEKFFQQTTKLLVLDVSHCKQFSDSVLETLAMNCRSLCELCAEGCEITDSGLTSLAQHNKQIRCLTISNTCITGDGISDAVRNKNWRHLQELRLDSCSKVNDDVLKLVIQNCPKIEILTFYNCAITDETSIFQDITKTCKKLKQLHWTISW